jgi:tricorn protease
MSAKITCLPLIGSIVLCLTPARGWADEDSSVPPQPRALDARMMRYPDVSATHIAFVYAGDIWVAPKTGGVANRLSSPRGEESFPRFSPDGSLIAFSGDYDGNLDIYVVPISGGIPKRLTHHGAPDRILDWYPDGKAILYATSMTSQKDRFNQFYRVPKDGGLPSQLPVPYGEFGTLSPDGLKLAYTPISTDFRTWKRYRGGMASDIWCFDLVSLAAKNLTRHQANDAQPLWHGTTIYFLSDRDPHKRVNIWAYDTQTNQIRQVTFFKDSDVHFPGLGPDEIVFENDGRLYLLKLATEKYSEVKISVVTDRATLKPRVENVASLIRNASISPTSKRAAFEARGEIFTVPAEHGVVRNLTRSSGVAERFPAWSPDGQWIACFSDHSDEYELTLLPTDGKGEKRTLTSLGPGFRYQPFWSPDSQKLAFIDKAMKLQIHDVKTKLTTSIDQGLSLYHGALTAFTVSWSSDSRWLAYARDLTNRNSAIFLYDTKSAQRRQVTSGFYNDDKPVFDPDGKHLYFRSSRAFDPIYSELDNTWIHANSANLVAVPLRTNVPSPLAPRNDEEPIKGKEKKAEPKEQKPGAQTAMSTTSSSADEPKEPANKSKKAARAKKKKTATPEPEKKDTAPKPVEIDLADFENRLVVLPPKAGRFANLQAVSGKLIYRRLPRSGSADEKSPVIFYDFEKREEKTILDDADDLALSANGQKLLVRKKGDYAIIDVKEGQKMDKKLATAGLETTVEPVAEWRQLFTEAWRLQRDYFYDPNLHGVDWDAMRQRYGALLGEAVTRWDVNYILGELIAELNASHTYRSGGDTEVALQRNVGYLGVDFALENGAYRLKKIIKGASWDHEVRSPLQQPGVNIKEGDYLLAVNGVPLDITLDPWAAFHGLADKPVMLSVNDRPKLEGAREVLVHTLASEARLRNLAWIEEKRRQVEEATQGQAGYIYVPDTGRGGQTELVRQFRGQFHKAALIIDERFNSGGQIPDRFIELLNRPLYNYWAVRDGKDWQWPPVSHLGPKVMLVNGWSGSGGDALPFYFRKAGLGPLIGMRTWGGLIGMTGVPGLIDGGSVTVPTFGIYSTKGKWIIEGYGVDPDIEVVDDPSLMAKGSDPQLEKAIEEILRLLKQKPPPSVKKPAYPQRDK